MNDSSEINLLKSKLRQLVPSDLPQLIHLRSNPIVNKYIERSDSISSDDAIQFIIDIQEKVSKRICFYWVITPPKSNKMIGTVCLWNIDNELNEAEIGYQLESSFFRQGIMSEVVLFCIKFGFETLKLDSLHAYIHKDNIASIYLVKKYKFEINKVKSNENKNNYIVYTLRK